MHLWCRDKTELRGVVVYVHGYGDDVDSAFTNHRLAAQFAKSSVHALFVAVAAPSGPDQRVAFDDLDGLLKRVAQRLGASLPDPVVLLGHSGGHRTLKAWLTSPRAQEVVLLDGFYGDPAPWSSWLTRRSNATLRLVGRETFEKAEAWRGSLPDAVRDQVRLQTANCSHSEIVTRGDWLPRVIGESSIPAPRIAVPAQT